MNTVFYAISTFCVALASYTLFGMSVLAWEDYCEARTRMADLAQRQWRQACKEWK